MGQQARIPQAQELVVPQAQVQQQQVAAQAQVQQFLGNAQNTHATEVTVSVNTSIARLQNRYPHVDVACALREVKQLVDQLSNRDNQKRLIQECLNRIERDPTTRSPSNLTLTEVLALIWHALQDKTACFEGSGTEIDEDTIESRKKTLIDNLYKAQFGYGNGNPLCFVGTMNKIIETLDQLHPDVQIITGRQAVKPYCNQSSNGFC
jgi:hypothetical protein